MHLKSPVFKKKISPPLTFKPRSFLGRGTTWKLQLLQLFVTCVTTIQLPRCQHSSIAMNKTWENETRRGPGVIIWFKRTYLGVWNNALDYRLANGRTLAAPEFDRLPGTLQSAHTSAFRSRLDILALRRWNKSVERKRVGGVRYVTLTIGRPVRISFRVSST